MDQEELLREIEKIVNKLGTDAETLFDLAIAYERTYLLLKIRDLIIDKDKMNDQIAVDTLAWAWQEISN